jgi:hypothetical protein
MPKKLLLGILLTLPLLAQTPAVADSQSELSDRDVSRQILAELRSIRETLNRTLAAQVQLLVSSEQVKIAYQILTSRSERLESMHGEMALIHSSLLEATRTAETLESQLNQTFDPELRGKIERQQKEQKALIAEQQERENELRGNEARLQRELQDAQGSMDQASARLAAIAGQVQHDSISTAK